MEKAESIGRSYSQKVHDARDVDLG
jgi:hypothetical protein